MIVPVNLSNLKEAAAVHAASWQESHRSFCTPEYISLHTPEHQAAYLKSKIEAGSSVYLLIADAPVGVVSVTGSLIEDLYVLPERQNRGHGTELLRFAIAKCTGTPALWILENNVRAKRLYERLGFSETGRRNVITDGLDEIELLMSEDPPNRKQRKDEMNRKALVVIDIQNDITRHYRDIIDRLNAAIEWAAESGMEIVYIQHNNLSPGTRTFKPGTKGAELAPELRIVSDHIFVKTKANALTSEKFSEFIRAKDIREFYIAGADATACVKSTCFNMTKAGYTVHVISDCVTSYDPKKVPKMLAYYADKGCEVRRLTEYQDAGARS